MEWEKQPPQQAEELNVGGGGGGMYVKVMTDEQMEVLRKQIAVYATICEHLVELHKSLTAQNDLSGVRLGNIYYDPLMTSGAHRIGGRQRWTPTPMQLQILERTFSQGIGNSIKPKIKEITAELLQHGQISETNVYNWFQNRRARSKRKQQASSASANNAESEVEAGVESSNEKTKENDFQPKQIVLSSRTDSAINDSVDPSTSKGESMLPQDGSTKIGGGFGQVPLYGNMLQNSRIEEQLAGKMELPGNYNPYLQPHDYKMVG